MKNRLILNVCNGNLFQVDLVLLRELDRAYEPGELVIAPLSVARKDELHPIEAVLQRPDGVRDHYLGSICLNSLAGRVPRDRLLAHMAEYEHLGWMAIPTDHGGLIYR